MCTKIKTCKQTGNNEYVYKKDRRLLRHSSSYLMIGVRYKANVLLLRHDAVARIFANGSAAFIKSYAAIDWNSCDSVKSL